MATESGRALRGTTRATVRKSSKASRKKSDVVAAEIPEVLITGCRDTQTSADASLANSFHGALTYHLVSVLRDAKGKISYRDLHEETTRLLKQKDFDQVPQLEGQAASFDRLFLSAM
jgi:hypothetical protein